MENNHNGETPVTEVQPADSETPKRKRRKRSEMPPMQPGDNFTKARLAQRYGETVRTTERRIERGEHPKPDFYLGVHAVWKWETILKHEAEAAERPLPVRRVAVRKTDERAADAAA
jgi:hypothetical protein